MPTYGRGIMRRTTLTEKHKAVALLIIALGQLSYIDIARMVQINRNSVTNWLKDAQFLALVEKFQAHIEDKLEDQALESVQRKNEVLLPKALKELEKML